jgi:hypothetical protein
VNDCKHDKGLVEGYYGHDCAVCGELVYPYGSEPWMTEDDGFHSIDDYQGDGWDDDDDGEFDCGWVRGVGCQLAGTEECDFECPHRDDNYKGLRLTQARLAKRASP